MQSLKLQKLLKYFDWQDLEGLEEIIFWVENGYINTYNHAGLKWELIFENKEQKYEHRLEAQLVSFIICHFFMTRFKFKALVS